MQNISFPMYTCMFYIKDNRNRNSTMENTNIKGAKVNCSPSCLEISSLNFDDAFSHPWTGVLER